MDFLKLAVLSIDGTLGYGGEYIVYNPDHVVLNMRRCEVLQKYTDEGLYPPARAWMNCTFEQRISAPFFPGCKARDQPAAQGLQVRRRRALLRLDLHERRREPRSRGRRARSPHQRDEEDSDHAGVVPVGHTVVTQSQLPTRWLGHAAVQHFNRPVSENNCARSTDPVLASSLLGPLCTEGVGSVAQSLRPRSGNAGNETPKQAERTT